MNWKKKFVKFWSYSPQFDGTQEIWVIFICRILCSSIAPIPMLQLFENLLFQRGLLRFYVFFLEFTINQKNVCKYWFRWRWMDELFFAPFFIIRYNVWKQGFRICWSVINESRPSSNRAWGVLCKWRGAEELWAAYSNREEYMNDENILRYIGEKYLLYPY